MPAFTNNEICEVFGIPEWSEKKIVLGEEEAFNVVEDLKEGIESPDVQLCRLPFPEFARDYFSKYDKNKKDFDQDPFLGFKLFLLSPENLKVYSDYAKGIHDSKESDEDCKRRKKRIWIVKGLLEENINDLITQYSGSEVVKANSCQGRFIYISRYIDIDMARQMNLKIAPFLERDGLGGYDFEEKLDCLNPAVKYFLALNLGWFGYEKMSVLDLVKLFHQPSKVLHHLRNTLLPLFEKPIGEFKYSLGYVDREYKAGETKEYTNKDYRDLDISLAVAFIRARYLSETEKKVVESLSIPKQRIYIARKYLFESDKQTAINLGLAERDVRLTVSEKAI